MKTLFKKDGTLKAKNRCRRKYHRTRRVVDLLIKDASFIGVTVNLITGVLLVKLALELGASPIEIGLLGAFPFLGQIFQLPSVIAASFIGSRKWNTMIGIVLYRLSILGLAAATLLPDKQMALQAVVLDVAIMNIAVGWGAGSWNGWVRELLHVTLLGRVFGKRMNNYTLFGTFSALIAAFLVDYMVGHQTDLLMYTFSGLFFFAFMIAMFSGFYVFQLPDVPAPKPDRKMFRELLAPLADKNFRRLMFFLMMMMFSMNLAVPFFPAYMLDVLGLPVSYVMGLWALGQFMQVPFFRWWGFVSDKFSHTTSLAVCLPFFVVSLLLWPLTTMPDQHMFTLPLLVIIHLFVGVGLAGILLSSQVIAMKMAPKKMTASYVAASAMLSSVSAGSASILGGFLAKDLMDKNLNINFEWLDAAGSHVVTIYGMSGYDFLFVFAAGLIAVSSPLLAAIVEKGKAPPQVVRDLMMHRAAGYFRSATTIPGWRHMVAMPSSFLGRKVMTNESIQKEAETAFKPVEEMIEKVEKVAEKAAEKAEKIKEERAAEKEAERQEKAAQKEADKG